VKEGIIIEGTKWKEIIPLFKDDERFLNMLGQPGSNPLELFWDIVDALEIDFRLKRDYVLDVLEEKRYEVSESAPYQDFKSLMSTDQRTSVIPNDLLKRIFENLVNKSRRHTSSRQSRKKPDAFRSLLRHMSEVTYESTWDEIRPLVVNKEEFKALELEEERLVVFEKVIRRLKEKRDEEKRYRESSRRDREESAHRDGRHDSKSRRRYEDDEYSRPRSLESTDQSRDREKYRDRSRSYSRREELDYDDRPKRRSEDDLRPGDRKVPRLRTMG
jgi:pre-mRNA-processing factor 40